MQDETSPSRDGFFRRLASSARRYLARQEADFGVVHPGGPDAYIAGLIHRIEMATPENPCYWCRDCGTGHPDSEPCRSGRVKAEEPRGERGR